MMTMKLTPFFISALVFVVEKMGTILQLTMTLEAMTMGPQLGVFSMGILMPWVDATVRCDL
jgi:solute carrier family 5 (sodium-coupled monocarboxylate transporter), member 8/12